MKAGTDERKERAARIAKRAQELLWPPDSRRTPIEGMSQRLWSLVRYAANRDGAEATPEWMASKTALWWFRQTAFGKVSLVELDEWLAARGLKFASKESGEGGRAVG
jgi:hypothetical protein